MKSDSCGISVFMRWSRGSLIGAMVLTMAFIGLAGCEQESGFQAPPPPKVTAAKPIKQNITIYDTFTGNTAAIDTVQIRARVPGFLEKMFFTEGAIVNKGDKLYLIQQDQYKASLEQANADVAAAKANYEAAKTKYDLIKEAFDSEAASRKELIEAQASKDQTKAQIAVAEAQVTQAKLNLSYTTISSPNTGRIDKTQVDPGNLVGQGEATLLTTVITFDPMYVYFTVNQRDLLKWLANHPRDTRDPERDPIKMLLYTANGQLYNHPGTLDFAAPQVDQSTGTVQLRAIVPNPDYNLYPGLFIRVDVPNEQTDAILIPRVALQRDMQGDYLMKVTELSNEAKQQAAAKIELIKQSAAGTPRAAMVGNLKNPTQTVERVNVELGSIIGDYQVVTSGLSENDMIIINGLQKARPGQPLYVEQPDPPLTPPKQPELDTAFLDEKKPAKPEAKTNPDDKNAAKVLRPKPESKSPAKPDSPSTN